MPFGMSLALPAFSLLVLQTAVPAPEVKAAAPFHDASLRLSYAVPESFKDASDLVKTAFQSSMANDNPATRCISLPFSRVHTGEGQLQLVVLARAEASCMGKTFDAHSVAELASGEAQGVAASGAHAHLSKVEDLKFQGRPASVVQGSFSLPTGQLLQTRVVCVLDSPDIACWQFLSNSTGALDAMGSFPVQFDGAPAAPLLPTLTH